MAAMACGLVDVFQSSGVEAVTLVYQGDAFVPLDSTVAGVVPPASATSTRLPCSAKRVSSTASPITRPMVGLSHGLVRVPAGSPSLVTAGSVRS